MSLKERKLSVIEKQIRRLFQKEQAEPRPLRKKGWKMARWGQMLQHEFVKDDVAIRAESLSYFTLFSMMPVLAGIFLLLTYFSEWGPVQKQFQSFLGQLLLPLPDEHRRDLLTFISDFKDQYLATISQKSTSIALIALGILLLIVGRIFFNIENLMNRIWSVSDSRPFLERIQNFLFCALVAPFLSLIALSLPHLLKHWLGVHIGNLLANCFLLTVLFGGLSFLFRFFPNVKVEWKSAYYGAAFTTGLFAITNFFLKYYFRFGTQTAYGKTAVLPIIAFFIYVLWLIFILGAEVSFLIQNENLFIGKNLSQHTIGEAILLVEVMKLLSDPANGKILKMTAAEISEHFQVSLLTMNKILHALKKRELILENHVEHEKHGTSYHSAQSFEKVDLGKLIKDYLNIDVLQQNFDVNAILQLLVKK